MLNHNFELSLLSFLYIIIKVAPAWAVTAAGRSWPLVRRHLPAPPPNSNNNSTRWTATTAGGRRGTRAAAAGSCFTCGGHDPYCGALLPSSPPPAPAPLSPASCAGGRCSSSLRLIAGAAAGRLQLSSWPNIGEIAAIGEGDLRFDLWVVFV
jgi:hypothetical protein